MNDRIPGINYDNPISYKGYRIYLSELYDLHGFQYEYVHDDYDGVGDANDNRFGTAKSVEDAKAQIDDRDG